MSDTVLSEVERFYRIWEGSKQVNPNGYRTILALFMSTVDPKIAPEVELRIGERHGG